jgi:DNA-binding SARP family transcriptional activator
MTLSRLRKLLKHDAVDQRRGKISLDPGQCWLDVWAARGACRDIEAGRPDGVTERLLDVYRGAFLEKERDEPWMLPARNQLRRQFAAAIAAGVKALEREGRMETAAALLRQASQRDPVTMVPSAPWRA